MKKLFFLRKLMLPIKKLTLSIKKFFSKKIVLFGEIDFLITHLFFLGAGVLAGLYYIFSSTILDFPSNLWVNSILFFGVLIYGLFQIILLKEKERRRKVDFNLKLSFEIFWYYVGGFLGLILGLAILLLFALGALIFWVLNLISVTFWIISGSIIIPLFVFWILSGRMIKREKEDKEARIFVEKTKKRLKEARIFDSISDELKDSF